jgi:methionyl aminopeptidase
VIERKSTREIAKQAQAGTIVAETLALLADAAQPGVTTAELDRIAERHIKRRGGVPTFKGYRGFPGSICSSPNDMIVHGIPGPYVLADGDILSLDVGVTYRGFVGDSAVTVPVGAVAADTLRLLAVCQESLRRMVEQCVVGNRLLDLGHACQAYVEGEGFGVVRQLVGHGVGRRMHEDPQIPNFGPPGRGPELQEGMVFAIEPMITAGEHDIRLDPDGWSIFTTDGSMAAHFEHTVAITADGPQILTLGPDGTSVVYRPISK